MVRTLLAAVLMVACSRASVNEPEVETLADLRFRVASNPRDGRARARLARALATDGKPGLALG
ncbi:MAG: hypothetical protein KJO07_15275, partial [Deltaproteobacteria bacterium]|nr:hypothetical protein [Deltaproteobacteria bacterium]